MKRWLIILLLFLPLWAFAEEAYPTPVQQKTTGKWGYQNAAGHWVIPPAFDEADPFLNGYARVSVTRSEQPLTHDGIIDSSGSFILPAMSKPFPDCLGFLWYRKIRFSAFLIQKAAFSPA